MRYIADITDPDKEYIPFASVSDIAGYKYYVHSTNKNF